MEIELNEEQVMLRDTVRRFAAEVVARPADLKVVSISAPAQNFSGEKTSVTYTVRNDGSAVWAGTRLWVDAIYISPDPTFIAARAVRMNAVNPKFVLRNHLAEQAIRQARDGDFGEVNRLLKVLQRPFDEQPEHAAYAGFPPDWAQHLEVSCSS